MPNYTGQITANTGNFPVSALELSKPTGKYVYRIFIRLFNVFSRRGFVRMIGNTCAPGFVFPQLNADQGIEQFKQTENSCGVLVVNVLGNQTFSKATAIPAEPFMVIEVKPDWKNLSDYLSAFSSKYRVRANKVLKSSELIVSKQLENLPPNEWLAACGNLLFHSLQNKTLAIGPNLSELLHCFQKSLGAQFQVKGYYLDGNMVGFISYIQDDNWLYATHLGIDENLALTYNLYQRMMYDVISFGLEHGVEQINLGRTATEIKSTLGAAPVENSFVIFTKNHFLRFIVKIYAKYIHKSPHYIQRNPFK